MMVEHYYSETPDSKLIITEFTENLRGMDTALFSGSGVFSIGRVDRGTKLLIEHCIMEEGWRVLDLGCGYGPVGISIARSFPKNEVVMTDINSRAVKLSRLGIKHNGIMNASVFQGNCYDKVSGRFDTILVNPPQNAGKAVCFCMIDGAKEHLKPGGLLQLVARHKKGGRLLSGHMEETFGNVDVVKRGSGYRIYLSRNG